MNQRFPHLASRLLNTPIAIKPDKAEVIVAAIADRFGIANLFRMDGQTVVLAPMAFDQEMEDEHRPASRADRGYDLIAGVAVITIEGTLVHKLGSLRPYSGMTGYDGIRAAFLSALMDPEARAIVLDIDSPGGEVAGCFDLVDLIYNARGGKPIWSILSEHAYSAAYAIASAAEFITVPRTGGAGSVGCICLHADLSKALGKAGISVTMIHYGERKADFNEYEPLSKAALQNAQHDIDVMGELFVATVARNRGLDPAAVRNTEAGTFLGPECVDVGFADAVMAPEDEAFPALLNELGLTPQQQGTQR